MEVIRSVDKMQRFALEARARGRRAGLVPTMGFLHQGHLSLVQLSREVDDMTVVSIFVNPTQFVPGEDYEAYPRDEAKDLALLEAAGTAVVFIPEARDVYPEEHVTRIAMEGPSAGWCGEARPGHFSGVVTVCTVLFNLCLPDRAYFGQKDAQQVAVIRRLVRDLRQPLEIRVGPTVREPDGLAMSSRNTYLQPHQRVAATALSKGLWKAEEAFETGERDPEKLLRAAREIWERELLVQGEYAGIVDAMTMRAVPEARNGDLILVAARVGRARLIDNWSLGAPWPPVLR